MQGGAQGAHLSLLQPAQGARLRARKDVRHRRCRRPAAVGEVDVQRAAVVPLAAALDQPGALHAREDAADGRALDLAVFGDGLLVGALLHGEVLEDLGLAGREPLPFGPRHDLALQREMALHEKVMKRGIHVCLAKQ